MPTVSRVYSFSLCVYLKSQNIKYHPDHIYYRNTHVTIRSSFLVDKWFQEEEKWEIW